MTIYSVSTASTYYRVVIEWDGWTVPAFERDLLIFAAGAASMRDGGPVGEATLVLRDDDVCRAEVWVNALNDEGPRI